MALYCAQMSPDMNPVIDRHPLHSNIFIAAGFSGKHYYMHVCCKHYNEGYINQAPMRIGTEDPWALTELAKAGGGWGGAAPQPRGIWGGTPHPGTFASRCLGL